MRYGGWFPRLLRTELSVFPYWSGNTGPGASVVDYRKARGPGIAGAARRKERARVFTEVTVEDRVLMLQLQGYDVRYDEKKGWWYVYDVPTKGNFMAWEFDEAIDKAIDG